MTVSKKRKFTDPEKGQKEDSGGQKTAGIDKVLLKSILDNSSDIITQFDLKQGKYMYISPSTKKILGYTPERIMRVGYEKALSLIHPDDLPKLKKAIESLRWRNRVKVEYRQKTSEGNYVWLSNYMMLVRDSKNKSLYRVSDIRDITDYKKAEIETAEAKQKITEILDSIQDDFYVLDRDWKFVYASRRFTSKLGKKSKDFKGKNIWKMFPKYKGTIFERNLRIAMEKRKIRRFEVSGKYTNSWYRMTAFPSKEGLTILGQEITERKKAEERLKYNEEKFRETSEYLENLLRYANAPIICWDSRFRITIFNHAFEHLTGYKQDQIIGKNLRLLFTKEDQEANMEKIKITMLGGHWENVEIRIRKKDGNIRTLLWNSANVYSRGKRKLVSTIAQGSDISDRIRLEEQKNEFFNIASHELKTPLTSIKAFNQILYQRISGAADKQTSHILARMEEQINRLTNLIVTMLDVTKIESGKLIYQKDEFNIDELVAETVKDVLLTSGKKYKIMIAAKTGKKITADRYRISQVLSNLLFNAIKYSKKSNVIVVKAKADRRNVTVSIRDYGIGVSKDDMVHLFEKFYRIDSNEGTADSFSNLGLGLYISSDIIKRHGGKIWVKSTPGKGSTFYFNLPIK